MPAAERYNLANQIDAWVLNDVLAWIDRAPLCLDHLDVLAVNLSGQSLGEPAFLTHVHDRMRRNPLAARKLCFEITETAAISNLERVQEFIKSMRSFGTRFALDDFGAGLSSFAYLRTLDVDYLKINGMFVKDAHEDPIHEAMVRAINEVGHVMGKKTIAEFVENDSVRQKLAAIGVDFVRGYGIGMPIPFGETCGLVPPSRLDSGSLGDGVLQDDLQFGDADRVKPENDCFVTTIEFQIRLVTLTDALFHTSKVHHTHNQQHAIIARWRIAMMVGDDTAKHLRQIPRSQQVGAVRGMQLSDGNIEHRIRHRQIATHLHHEILDDAQQGHLADVVQQTSQESVIYQLMHADLPGQPATAKSNGVGVSPQLHQALTKLAARCAVHALLTRCQGETCDLPVTQTHDGINESSHFAQAREET